MYQKEPVCANLTCFDLDDERLAPEVETNLYRITQEALNNISKHAQASNVSVILERRDHHVALIVEDDGTGFDVDKEILPTDSGKGLGLTGMRERAALVGGTTEIESTVGAGTTILVRIPLSPDGQRG